jgi:Protein of unknown function (DUF3054)
VALPLLDALALVVFVAVGVGTHGASVGAFLRDATCFLGAWFAVALAARLYARGGRPRLMVTWLVGVSGAVFLRAAIVDRWPGAFYGVALGFTAVLIGAARIIGTRLRRTRPVPGTRHPDVTRPSRRPE